MKLTRMPLAIQIWGVFAALTLLVFALLAVMLPVMLKDFFTEQLYRILIDSQAQFHVAEKQAVKPSLSQATREGSRQLPSVGQVPVIIAPEEIRIRMTDHIQVNPDALPQPEKGPLIQHFVLRSNGDAVGELPTVDQPYVSVIRNNALSQEQAVKTYTLRTDKQSLFYVIRKEPSKGQTNYIVSYAWSTYRNALVKALFVRLMWLMVILIVVSWVPCMVLARYLTRPLVQMERHVERLAERDWHEPLATNRRDEIGRLAMAIESMRQRLVRQDKALQYYLQNMSHELKTPIMVIRSYGQSILDGILPEGTLRGSLQVMDQEAERLEGCIRDLLQLNKWNYIATREQCKAPFALRPLVDAVWERLRHRRPDVRWEMDLPDTSWICGDQEQWRVVIENLLDNQLRYARNVISIRAVTEGPGEVTALCIANDGPAMEEDLLREVFEPFRTGPNGQYGLGLAIVRQIAANHRMSVRAANEAAGVAFYLERIRKSG